MEKHELEGKISDMEHLLGAIRVAMQHGGSFLVNRRAPQGPIMREPNLSYIHKASWGMYAAGVDHGIIAKMLDWARDNAQKLGLHYASELARRRNRLKPYADL